MDTFGYLVEFRELNHLCVTPYLCALCVEKKHPTTVIYYFQHRDTE
jgi:hypothetical protein